MHFCMQPCYSFILDIMAYISYFSHHMLSTNHKYTQPCPPAAQKLKKIWDFLMGSSRQAIVPGRLSVELWSLFAALLPRVFDLVFCKTLFSNKYYIL
jgi:hypothetical protein